MQPNFSTRKTLRPLLVLLVFVAARPAWGQKFIAIKHTEERTVKIIDNDVDVLTFRFGDQLKEGVDPKYTRSCYIHPLYSLDGQVLTEDFPQDHLHHHGVFWTWPIVKTRGKDTQTWHPATPSLRQHFVRMLGGGLEDTGPEFSSEHVWKLDETEIVAREVLKLLVHPADAVGRAIDIEIELQAVGGPLTLQGSQDQKKGYGGLCLRGAPLFQDAVLTTDKGELKQDSTNVPFRWADMSTAEWGITIFVSPDHPGYPTTWLIRNTYAGILNPSWPGVESATISPGDPVILKYRIYVHRGDVQAGRVLEAYRHYLSGR